MVSWGNDNGRIYLGNWNNHVCDASALGSTTGNNTFERVTFIIPYLLDQLGDYSGDPLAWKRATYRLVTPSTPWYATVSRQTRFRLPTEEKRKMDHPKNELVVSATWNENAAMSPWLSVKDLKRESS